MYVDTLAVCQRPDRASAHLCRAVGPDMHGSGRAAPTREQVICLLKALMGFAVKRYPCVLLAEGCSNACSSQTLCCRSKRISFHSFPLPTGGSGMTPDSSKEKGDANKEGGLNCADNTKK